MLGHLVALTDQVVGTDIRCLGVPLVAGHEPGQGLVGSQVGGRAVTGGPGGIGCGKKA